MSMDSLGAVCELRGPSKSEYILTRSDQVLTSGRWIGRDREREVILVDGNLKGKPHENDSLHH